MTYVRQMMEDERGYCDELWKKMAELGWMGLIYPEEFGGAGLTMVDLVVVLEEMGRVCFPGPFFSTVCLGGLAILEAGNQNRNKSICRGSPQAIAKRRWRYVEENARWDEKGIEADGEESRERVTHLNGIKLFVPDAHVADILVCASSHRADGVTATFLIDRQQSGRDRDAAEDDGSDAQALRGALEKVAGRCRAVLGRPQVRDGRLSLGFLIDRAKSRSVRRDVRRRAAGARHERRVRQSARAIRPTDRLVSRPSSTSAPICWCR